MEEAWFNGLQWRFLSRENRKQHSLNSENMISTKPAPVNKNSCDCSKTVEGTREQTGTNCRGEKSGME